MLRFINRSLFFLNMNYFILDLLLKSLVVNVLIKILYFLGIFLLEGKFFNDSFNGPSKFNRGKKKQFKDLLIKIVGFFENIMKDPCF